VLYTDGLVERRGETLDAGLHRLAVAVERHGAETPERLATLLLHEILADTAQPDDVALIAARLVPPPLQQRIPADPARLSAVRRAVLAWGTDAALSGDTLEDLQLALGETVANAVEHAYRDHPGGQCSFSVTRCPDGSVDVRVEDFGTWRPVPSDAGFRGRGLQMIRRLAEDVTVEETPGGGTTVRFRMPAATGRPQEAAPSSSPAPVRPVEGASLRADGAVVLLAGELDLASAPALRSELFAVLDSREGDVTLDLRGLTFLASAGLGLLLESEQRTRLAGQALRVLVDPDGQPARVLRLAGLDGLAGPGGLGGPDGGDQAAAR
jgi:anti-anti-sigma factor